METKLCSHRDNMFLEYIVSFKPILNMMYNTIGHYIVCVVIGKILFEDLGYVVWLLTFRNY